MSLRPVENLAGLSTQEKKKTTLSMHVELQIVQTEYHYSVWTVSV